MRLFPCLLVLAAVPLAATQAADDETTKPPGPPAVTFSEKSVTVFPMALTPGDKVNAQFGQRVGEVVGMLLERSGMKEVQTAKAQFAPEPEQDVKQVADAFAQFAAKQKIKTPYALFGQILGTPKTGPQAIRTIVVNAQGKVLLAEEIGRDEFAKSAPIVPKDPMTCCVFLVHRLRDPWQLDDPLRPGATGGETEANWQKKTGVPEKEELAAMKSRAAQLRKRIGSSSLTVLPVRASGKVDAEAAASLADQLDGIGFSKIIAAKEGPALDVPDDSNEQKVLWDTAKLVREYLQEHAPAAEYVVVADCGIGRAKNRTDVGYVHFIVCDRKGDWVLVDYQNSHHEDFQQTEPDSLEDCLKLVRIRLDRRITEAN